MLSKTKKILFLTSGLAGALVLSSAAGVALSACTIEAVNGSGNGSSSDGITLPDTWYNKDINWTDATSLNNLIIDNQGFVYSNKYMTEIIAILPGYESSTLTIPSSVTSISGYNKITTNASTGAVTKTATGAFEGLDTITNLKFAGNKITSIGARAFYNCTSLQSVVLPSLVTLVDSYAFYGCSALNSINLNNVQYIGNYAFYGAMSNVPSASIDLNLNSTVLIASNAFGNATGIRSVDFSKNTTLTQIAQAAFSGCTSLSGDIDLSNATKLITIGNSAGTSGSTFANSAITNVYLPSVAGLRTIAASTFYNCSNLITVGPKGTTGFTATESFLIIHNKAFSGTKIASVDISSINNTAPLQTGAFSGMTALTSVNLGTRITTIPASCFMNCSSLTSLTLPSSITSISGGSPTAYGSGSSPSITFSSTDNDASYPAFYGSGLTSIDLSTVTSYQVSTSTTSSTALNLPSTLFYNCASLTSVTLKEGTTSIGAGAFAGTTALTSISIGSSSTTSGYTATSDITTVGQYAFWKSGISSVDLSAINNTSYTTLQSYTFMDCPNLTTIKLPNKITTINSYAVYNTPELTTADLSELPLTSIANYNFSDCKLTEVDLTNSTITQIPSSSSHLFRNLTSSTLVELPSTLWDIAASNTAFTYSQDSTTLIPLNINFPDGYAPNTTSVSGFTNGNLSAHTMFSRVSGSLDMSSFTTLRSIGVRTFFGGPVTDLTFNASKFASGRFGIYYSDDAAGKWGYLGFLGSNSVTNNTDTNANPGTYVTTNLPFGNMTGLSTITFNNFTNSSTTSSSSLLAKTTEETWYEVARIISSFDKSANNSNGVIPNLSTWEKNPITVEVGPNEDDDNEDTISFVELNDGDDLLVRISDDMSEDDKTFNYCNVTWTINMDSANGTITLTSSADVDTYQLAAEKSDGSGYDTYKAFFNTKSTTNDNTTTITPNSTIKVTLNVVAAASTK